MVKASWRALSRNWPGAGEPDIPKGPLAVGLDIGGPAGTWARGNAAFLHSSTAPTCPPATRRDAPRSSTPARLEASCAPTSSSSTAARVRAAARPQPPARPPPPASPPRPAPAAGAAPPAWAAPMPPSRWYSCPAGETPPLPYGPGTAHRVDRWTDAPTHLSICTPPHGSTSSPHEGTAPTPPGRHKLTSLSPTRHGDPSSTRPLSTVSTLGLLWVYPLARCLLFANGTPRGGTCSWALGCARSRPLGAGERPSPACA